MSKTTNLISIDHNGEFVYHGLNSHVSKKYRADTPLDKSFVPYLIMAFCILFLILSIFAPKIYLSNNIYYISREISRLHAVKEILAEEKLRLQGEIEKIHNKHLLLELEGQK